jgi:hypothetical protein
VSLHQRVIVDYNSTGGSAHPALFSRALWDRGLDVQAALYVRAVKAAHGTAPDFYFVAQETTAPYALSVISLDPEGWEFAQAKVGRALEIWQECQATGRWPSYPSRTCYAEVPGYVRTAWEFHGYYQEVTA